MYWFWENLQELAHIATIVLVFGIGIAVGQYLQGEKLNRRTIAHEKLTSIYAIGIEHPVLASGHFDVRLFDSYEENLEVIEKYLWIYSAIEANLEHLFKTHKSDADWLDTIKYNIAAHRNFILSDWHAANGWWSTYDPEFRGFMARDVFRIPDEKMREWTAIPPSLVPPFGTTTETGSGIIGSDEGAGPR